MKLVSDTWMVLLHPFNYATVFTHLFVAASLRLMPFEKNPHTTFFAHQNSTTPPKKEQIHHKLNPLHVAGIPWKKSALSCSFTCHLSSWNRSICEGIFCAERNICVYGIFVDPRARTASSGHVQPPHHHTTIVLSRRSLSHMSSCNAVHQRYCQGSRPQYLGKWRSQQQRTGSRVG